MFFDTLFNKKNHWNNQIIQVNNHNAKEEFGICIFIGEILFYFCMNNFMFGKLNPSSAGSVI